MFSQARKIIIETSLKHLMFVRKRQVILKQLWFPIYVEFLPKFALNLFVIIRFLGQIFLIGNAEFKKRPKVFNANKREL